MVEPIARRRLNIIQGEAKWGSGEDLVLTTLLGSCVAACIRDPVAGIGGMNHFLLPGSGDASHSSRSESYGLYLMELLINGLMKKGARKDRLEVKLFGGARTLDGLTDIGSKNAKFAKDFLAMEGIPCRGGDLGGDKGRRIEYWPHTGRARQIFIEKSAGLPPPPPIRVRQESIGDLELF
ncbi:MULTISPECIES: chemotaxis protein CheD [unclassified Aureimonas]|uniref:chemotaxis protein CheD n=1 Tax=unclassified Aureimonas TaxID=2615206 RepID=UPI0006FD5701|nr:MULTISPECIES: chemotaxis protein CheD [unclassified Aureimonas]KQT53907.1 chemotaxis protein CheD [Aureimonas sp. Leaf427]KQT71651.1 chemotaxis protein CheD [Aureimonas sp. Leaf460]